MSSRYSVEATAGRSSSLGLRRFQLGPVRAGSESAPEAAVAEETALAHERRPLAHVMSNTGGLRRDVEMKESSDSTMSAAEGMMCYSSKQDLSKPPPLSPHNQENFGLMHLPSPIAAPNSPPRFMELLRSVRSAEAIQAAVVSDSESLPFSMPQPKLELPSLMSVVRAPCDASRLLKLQRSRTPSPDAAHSRSIEVRPST